MFRSEIVPFRREKRRVANATPKEFPVKKSQLKAGKSQGFGMRLVLMASRAG